MLDCVARANPLLPALGGRLGVWTPVREPEAVEEAGLTGASVDLSKDCSCCMDILREL